MTIEEEGGGHVTKSVFTVHWDPAIVKLRPPPSWECDGLGLILCVDSNESVSATGRDSTYYTAYHWRDVSQRQEHCNGEEPFVGFEIKQAGHAPALMSETEIGILGVPLVCVTSNSLSRFSIFEEAC